MSKKSFEPKKCAICGKKFKPKRSWQKYCSVECQKEAKRRTAIKWYEKNKEGGILGNITINDLVENPNHSWKYHLILYSFEQARLEKKKIEEMHYSDRIKKMALTRIGINTTFRYNDHIFPYLSFTALKRYTGLPDNILSRYLKKMIQLGILSKENNQYYLSNKFIYEPLKLLQINHIKQTLSDNIIFSPSFVTYMNNIQTKDLDEEDLEDYHKLEEYMKKGFFYFTRWFSMVQNKKYAKVLNELLNEFPMPPLFKLYIWLRHHLGNSFYYYYIPILKKYKFFSEGLTSAKLFGFESEGQLIHILLENTLLSILNDKYKDVDFYQLDEDVHNLFINRYALIEIFEEESRNELEKIAKSDFMISFLPLLTVLREFNDQFNKKEDEMKPLDIIKRDSIIESMDSLFKDIPPSSDLWDIITSPKIGDVKDFNFEKYWKKTEGGGVFSNNWYLRNIMDFEEWKPVFKILIEFFGGIDFFNKHWSSYLKELDYWALISQMPALPDEYEDLFY